MLSKQANTGFSLLDKVPIALFYGFLVPRIAEQIRDDICYNNCNVKMIGVPSDKFTVIGPSEDILWDYYGINVKNIESLANSILQ